VRLVFNEPETPTTRRIRIALDGTPFSYQAGQAASLSVGSEPTPYSIASAPAETARHGWLEFLVKVDGSNRFGALVDRLAPDTSVKVAGPTGTFTMTDAASDAPLLFVAGGTGIAPLRSMIRQALDEGHAGSLALVYSARTPDEFAYHHEFQDLNRRGQLSLSLTLTGRADDWSHARGRAGIPHFTEHVQPGVVAFVCGPPAMVTDVTAALTSLRVPGNQIRTENW